MESNDPRSALDEAGQARQRLAAGLRLPAGLHPVLAAAVAVQVSTAAYGIADHGDAGLVVALVGIVVFLGVAGAMLYQFRRINGVRVDALASQIVLGTSTTATTAYVGGFGAATWAASDSRWWLVAAASVAGGAGYAYGAFRWWHAYQQDPAAHTGGASPRVLAGIAALTCLGLIALLVMS